MPKYIFLRHSYKNSVLSMSMLFAVFLIPILWLFALCRQNNFFMQHLLQPSTYPAHPLSYDCSLIRAKTYIVNRFLSLHQCSIIQDMRPCFRCKTHNYTILQPDIRTVLTAAAAMLIVNWPECMSVLWSDYPCESHVSFLRWQIPK